MPSPLGHALGGLIVALTLAPDGSSRTSSPPYPRPWRRLWALAVISACLPDVDFLWGRHNMETHSLGFALIVSAVVYAWERRAGTGAPARAALVAFAAVGTHVLFDWLGSDDSPPLGVMALWPLTSEFFFADAFVFEAISRRYWLPGFVAHNAWAIVREVLMLGPLALGLHAWRRWRAAP